MKKLQNYIICSIMMIIPHQNYAQECCYAAPAVSFNNRFPGNYMDLAVGAVIGAAAGAGTGYAAARSDRSQCRSHGCKEHQKCLTFTIPAEIEMGLYSSGSIFDFEVQFLVITPDGQTVLGNFEAFTVTVGSEQYSPTLIGTVKAPAICGTYQIGFNIELTADEPIEQIYTLLTPFVTLGQDQTQSVFYNDDYSYVYLLPASDITTVSGQFLVPYQYTEACTLKKSHKE